MPILWWDSITSEQEEDLLYWGNVIEDDLTTEDKEKLAILIRDNKFLAWDCRCGNRCYWAILDKDEWMDFQGAQQNDYVSYPGDRKVFTQEALLSMCDSCRSGCGHFEIPEFVSRIGT